MVWAQHWHRANIVRVYTRSDPKGWEIIELVTVLVVTWHSLTIGYSPLTLSVKSPTSALFPQAVDEGASLPAVDLGAKLGDLTITVDNVEGTGSSRLSRAEKA